MTIRKRQSAIAAASVLALMPCSAQGAYPTKHTVSLDGSKIEDERRLSNQKHVRGQRRLQGEDIVKWGNGYVYDDIKKDSDIPIIRFPFSRGRDEWGQGLGGNIQDSGETIQSSFPECKTMRLDFSKAADRKSVV